MKALAWGLIIVAYTVAGAWWSGLLASTEEPPLRASSEAYQRWIDREARRTKRIWVWQSGLVLIMVLWWIINYQLPV